MLDQSPLKEQFGDIIVSPRKGCLRDQLYNKAIRDDPFFEGLYHKRPQDYEDFFSLLEGLLAFNP